MGRGGPASLGGKKRTTNAEVTELLALIIIHCIRVEIRLVICALHSKEEKGAKTVGPVPDRATWPKYLLAFAVRLPPSGPLDVKMISSQICTVRLALKLVSALKGLCFCCTLSQTTPAAGYVPVDYASPTDYLTCGILENSRKTQYPSISLQLAGAKKVQKVLFRPGILKRFLAPSEGADAVRDMSMRSLDRDDGKGAEDAERCAHELVLKLQYEGGRNNIYRGNISAIRRVDAAAGACCMGHVELICPQHGSVCLIRPGTGRRARDEQVWGV
jgi:hypothetical protein